MATTVVHKNDLPFFGAQPLLSIASQTSFAALIFELLSRQPPQPSQLRLFETILNISIDHGPDAPSAAATIQAARSGKTISESVSAGISQINDTHGGAIEPAMELFYQIDREHLSVRDLVGQSLSQGRKIAGFGHRIYTIDPRSQLLFKLAGEESLPDKFIRIARQVERELSVVKGRPLPVNIDGSIAAILCAFGWNPRLGKAVFIIARTPGLCGQFLNAAG